MASNENGQNNSGGGNENAQLTFLGLLAACAALWKNEGSIRMWFYNNIVFVVLAVIGLLALVGMWLWRKFKKKEEEYFARRRKLRQLQTHGRDDQFYPRRED